MTDVNFYQTQKVLWKSNGFFSPATGEAVKLTSSEKAIYMYLTDRITFFVEKQGSEFFEEQGTVAEELGLEKKTVWRCMKKFKDHAVVVGQSRRSSKGNMLWFYTRIEKNLNFWVGSEQEPKPLTPVKIGKSQAATKQPYKHVYDPFEEEGSPF